MATRIWTGASKAVAQVDTLTPGGTIEATDIFKVTIGAKTVQAAAGGTTAAAAATALYTALAASTEPEFTEITWTDSTGYITATAVTAGKPFTLTLTTTESDGSAADAQTFTQATTTSSSGPNHWDDANNWDALAVPTTGDDVYIQNSAVSILYGLAQTSVTLATLTIDQSFTGDIGLKDHNGSYYEYRATELAIKATAVTIGNGEGTGSGLMRLNLSSAQTTVNVNNTGTSSETGFAALRLRGTHSSNAVNINKGQVDIAYRPGHTATVATLNIGYRTNVEGDATVRCGAGVTLTTVNKAGGFLETNSAITTLTQNAGTTRHQAGAVTTAVVRGGDLVYISSGTLTTGTVSGDGHLDYSQDMRSKAITNPVEMYGGGARFSDPFKVVSSLVLDLNEVVLRGGLTLGVNVRITRGTPA